ncbi:MAG: cupin domain-containing protein [Actinomycetes bacterium]|nr:MAG: cupin [Actinomycetota bacterium]
MTTDVPATAAALGLEPHPEGGWYRRTWTSEVTVETPRGTRPTATAIHYLLVEGQSSRWHVVASDELWLWHGPGTLVVSLGGSGETPDEDHATEVRLGPDAAAGDVAQCLVRAGVWQSARLIGTDEVLVTCVVSPGFDFADWRAL